ncbi:MAG: radical SAM family heme chaperone HemW [Bacteroidota bacterium]
MTSLYVHIPFCARRCVYCDFFFTTTDKNYGAFVQALSVEIEAVGKKHGRGHDGERLPLRTIYLGGGTPSLLPLDEVKTILNAVHAHFDTSHVEEVTFEANPEDLAPTDDPAAGLDYLRGLRAMGVTRLSLGVQSFYDEDLAFMNRVHDAEQAERAVDHALEAFESLSVDFIFGLPEQPFELWGANLEKALRLGVPHLSTYSLTVEERTPLHKQVQRGFVEPVADEAMRERFLFTIDYLTGKGYDHYEVCSFALPRDGDATHRSLHNQAYWRHQNYLGVGPSAHSLWWRTGSLADRWANVRSMRHYRTLLDLHELPTDEIDTLDLESLGDEYVLLSLRLMDEGLDLDHARHRYGFDLQTSRQSALADLQRGGLIRPLDDGRVRLTKEGAVVADAVALKLIGG